MPRRCTVNESAPTSEMIASDTIAFMPWISETTVTIELSDLFAVTGATGRDNGRSDCPGPANECCTSGKSGRSAMARRVRALLRSEHAAAV